MITKENPFILTGTMLLVHEILKQFSEGKMRTTHVQIGECSGQACIARCRMTAYIAVVFWDDLTFGHLPEDETVTVYVIGAGVDVINFVSVEECVARIYLSNDGMQTDPSDLLKIAETAFLDAIISKLLQNLETSLEIVKNSNI